MRSISTEVKHGSDTIFNDFPLDLNDFQGNVTPLALTVHGSMGQRGFVFGGSLGLMWARDLSVRHTVSTVEDGFSEDVPSLVAGVEGTMTGLFMVNASAEALYRLSFNRWSLFAHVGLGLSVRVIDTQFQIDGVDNDISAVGLSFLLPVGGGVDFDLPYDLFANLTYNNYVLPTGAHAVQAGLGFYY